ncbi:MAG: hypothetical protein HGGPFJEG_01630 [Ignavibacteria bacterium]|nr:hypothetical protein [Ignavibacteria bacterium]
MIKQNNKFIVELKDALKIIVFIISVFMFFVLFLSYFFPEFFLKLTPACISKTVYNDECFMCGTSRAFIEASNGNFSEASILNKFSPYLFVIFFILSLNFLYNALMFFIKTKTFSNVFRKEDLKNYFIK